MWKRFTAAGLIAVALLATTPATLGATTDDDSVIRFYDAVDEFGWDVPPELRDETILNLLAKMAILDKLDAFSEELPAEIREATDAASPPPDTDVDTMRKAAIEVDNFLSFLANEIRRSSSVGEQRPLTALGDMTPAWRTRILRGDTNFIPTAAYSLTLSVLLSEDTLARIPAEDRGVEFVELEWFTEQPYVAETVGFILQDVESGFPFFPGDPTLFGGDPPLFAGDPAFGPGADQPVEPIEPVEQVATEPSEAPEPPEELVQAPAPNSESGQAATSTTSDERTDTPADGALGSARPWIAVGLAASMVGAVWLKTRRRRSSTRADAPDATHRLINAGSESEVGAVSIADAKQRTGAPEAFLVRFHADKCWHAGQGSLVVGSRVTEAIESGQDITGILRDDPVVGSGSHAVAAVPVIANGSVIGMLGVTGPAKRPFGAETRTELDRLAPAVAAALLNIDRLGSITELALVDGLTALGNRRRLDRDLDQILSRATPDGPPVAFAMIDVDHFKKYNDANGHVAGDKALREVADVISATVRDGDVVYRYGGEEFSILFPLTDRGEAQAIAQRVREAVEAATFEGESSQPGGNLTVSVGVAALADTTPDDIKDRADQALYLAKQSGRNRVMLDA